MVNFYNKRNFVRVLASHGTKHSKSGSHGIALALYSQLHDIFRIEVVRILCEARSRRMLDALIYWKDGQITSAVKPTVAIHPVHVRQYTDIAIRMSPHTINKIRAWQMQTLFRDLWRFESQ